MKKSLLCILLACVLLLGGCSLISPPAETKGMAACTQLMLDLHSMMKSTEEFTMTVYYATPQTDPAQIKQSKNDLEYTITRLKETLFPSCQPYLSTIMNKEEQVLSLLDDYAKSHQLAYEAFECYTRQDEQKYIDLWLEAVNIAVASDDATRTLIASWRDANKQVISKVTDIRFQRSRAQKISNCQQMTEMLLMLMEGEWWLDDACGEAALYFANDESADVEYMESSIQMYESYRAEFQSMYDNADRKVKRLCAPLQKEIALPMDGIVEQLRTAIEAMKIQNDSQAAEIVAYKQSYIKTYAFLRLSFMQYQGQCIRDFKKAVQ